MNIKERIRDYLAQGRLMQLATTADGQPWICTVYYIEDDAMNLYWLSLPERRHSQELRQSNKVAVAIAIKPDQPVIGLQAEGRAKEVRDTVVVRRVMKDYVAKYDAGHDFYDNFMNGTNKHMLYRIVPALFVLFDELNFPANNRQEWRP